MILASMDGNPGTRPAYPQLMENWEITRSRIRCYTLVPLEDVRLMEGGEGQSGAGCTPPMSQGQALQTALLTRFQRTRGVYQPILGGDQGRTHRSRMVTLEALQSWEDG